MKKIINLRPEDYYRQDNNTVLPSVACMPTARVMFYLGNGIEFKNPFPDVSVDDGFMLALRSPEAYAFAKQKYPGLIAENYYPNEIHGMYHSYLDHLVVGHQVSDFITGLTFENYIERMEAGEVIMTSGEFQEAHLNGHAFDAIGVLIPDRGEPALILADPFGDFRELYKKGSGYGVVMTREDFYTHAKPAGKLRKWGHVKI